MSDRTPHNLKTTVNMTSVYTARFSLAGATGSIINSTDMRTTISGTGPTSDDATGGIITLTLPTGSIPRQVLHWDAELQAGSSRAGVYRLDMVKFDTSNGQIQVRLMSGTLPAAGNGPVGIGAVTMTAAEKATANLTGSVTAIVRYTDRTR